MFLKLLVKALALAVAFMKITQVLRWTELIDL
jgi:hypothetical protein